MSFALGFGMNTERGITFMAEVQDVFLASFAAYRETHAVFLQEEKVAKAIMTCRTNALGGHLDVCPACGYTRPSYNSCRNRHCPKCQTVKKEQWIGKRMQDVLEVKHFHTVFTIPDELNTLVLQNKHMLYTLLFTASAETVRQLTADPAYLGASIGCTSILHSWGSTMSFHPHIHMVSTAGGMTADGRWKDTRDQFFLPVKVLSRVFRGKFLSGCKALYATGAISLRKENGTDLPPTAFSDLLTTCWHKEWVVYAKVPFNGAEGVFEYLGRYTHRLAISNNRILSVKDGKTTFLWKDYQDAAKMKKMTLSNEEFIRRFLLHVVPHGYTRIRHYGLYASRSKTTRLERFRRALSIQRNKKPSKQQRQLESPFEIVLRILGHDPRVCPQCGCVLYQEPLARAAPV